MTTMDEAAQVRCVRVFESLPRPIVTIQTIHNLLSHGDASGIPRIRAEVAVLVDWITRLDAATENLK